MYIAVILLPESTLIIGGQIIADYCGLNNCRLFDYWVEKYVYVRFIVLTKQISIIDISIL